MTSEIIQNILRWILLMAIQILIFNNIYLGGVYNPFIYVLIILSLPIESSPLVTLLIAFFTGFVLDLFSHTFGLHTMAFTLFGFLRPIVLRLVAPRDGYAFGSNANVLEMQLGRYSMYAVLLIFSHHLLLFLLEGFSGGGSIGGVFLKVVVNSLLTFVVVMVAQSFTRKKT